MSTEALTGYADGPDAVATAYILQCAWERRAYPSRARAQTPTVRGISGICIDMDIDMSRTAHVATRKSRRP